MLEYYKLVGRVPRCGDRFFPKTSKQHVTVPLIHLLRSVYLQRRRSISNPYGPKPLNPQILEASLHPGQEHPRLEAEPGCCISFPTTPPTQPPLCTPTRTRTFSPWAKDLNETKYSRSFFLLRGPPAQNDATKPMPHRSHHAQHQSENSKPRKLQVTYKPHSVIMNIPRSFS